MKKYVLICVCALITMISSTCASPSLLGANHSRCSPTELLRLETPLPPLTPAQPSANAEGLKVAVLNIRSGFGPSNDRTPANVEARLVRIAAALAEVGPPDVIGLNEVDFRSRRTGFVDQAVFIATQLRQTGFHYRVVRGPAWLRDTPGSEVRYGNALLIRHPIEQRRRCRFADLSECEASSAIDDLPHASLGAPWSWLSHEPRGVVMADFRWQGRSVRAIVTHLDPFSAQARETQAAQIIAGLVPSDGSVVLLGDMNSVPTQFTLDRQWFGADRTHDVLTSGRLFDLREELVGDDPSAWARWATYPVERPRWGLDGAFASADLTTMSLDVFGEGLADHLGLVATLLPVTDAAVLSARRARHTQLRHRRMDRLQRCDVPNGSASSFLAWLRQVNSPLETAARDNTD